jgi:hypothetical protein
VSVSRPSASAPPKTTARQAATQNLKRKWLGDNATDPVGSSDDDDNIAAPPPRASASTGVPSRFSKRTARAGAVEAPEAKHLEMASNEMSASASASASARGRKPWTVRDLQMIAELAVEVGEEPWEALKYTARGELLHKKVCCVHLMRLALTDCGISIQSDRSLRGRKGTEFALKVS